MEHDAARPEGRKSGYGVPVPEYERHLGWIVERYAPGGPGSKTRQTQQTRVVLCVPPPVDEEERLRITTERRGMPADLLDRDAERTRAYAEAARRVGAKHAEFVSTADLHAAFLERGAGWEKALLSDGLHFTEAGHALAFETVLAAVPPESKPDRFALDAPTHDALVGANATDDWHGHLRESLG